MAVQHKSWCGAAGTPLAQKEKKKQTLDIILPDPLLEWTGSDAAGAVIALRSSLLGDSTIPATLGENLMHAFLKAMAGSPAIPSALLLYGSAVTLASSGSPVIDALRRMQSDGCEILSCQISFTALVKADQPAVGRLADWVDLTDRMQKARHVLWP